MLAASLGARPRGTSHTGSRGEPPKILCREHRSAPDQQGRALSSVARARDTEAMPQAKASASLLKKRAPHPTQNGPEATLASDHVASKPEDAAFQNGDSRFAKVDAGPLLKIAWTNDLEVARRAARRAGILTASGKLSKKYR